MKHALTSINKPHTDNIFSGKKRIEWRKRPLPKTTHYCYETKNKGGCGKVVGTMEIVRNISFKSIDDIPTELINLGCVPAEFLIEYANGGKIYANVIENAQRYDEPKELWNFKKECVGYVRNDKDCCFETCPEYDLGGCDGRYKPIYQPPMSWCYVEELGV